MFEMVTGYVALDGGQTYYEEAGMGEPLILAHAGFLDSRMWDRQWEVFTQHYRAVRYDMRGYGRSSVVTAPLDRRENLHGLLDHLGMPQAHLVGCAMGGALMLDYALEHPERVLSLTLISVVPGGFQRQTRVSQTMRDMITAMHCRQLRIASELQLQMWIDGPFRTSAQVDPVLRQAASEMNSIPVANKTWLIADSHPLHPLNPPAVQRLHEVRCPTLIVTGALDDPEVLRAADVMASAIPQAKKVIISSCAHVPNMEKPDEFNRTVMDFLARGHEVDDDRNARTAS